MGALGYGGLEALCIYAVFASPTYSGEGLVALIGVWIFAICAITKINRNEWV